MTMSGVRQIGALVLLVLLAGCNAAAPAVLDGGATAAPTLAPIPSLSASAGIQPPALAEIADAMTLEEQVAQLFVLRLETDAGGAFETLTEQARAYIGETGAGGYILFRGNLDTEEQTRRLLLDVAAAMDMPPLFVIDEEGGNVSRLSALSGYEKTPSAKKLAGGGVLEALQAGRKIGAKLKAIGVHLNCAPVADVLTEKKNTAIGDRSFGDDPAAVSDLASAFQQGLHMEGILTAVKHFPGHGATKGDPHARAVETSDTAEEIRRIALPPFQRLIAGGADCVMAGHIRAPSVDASGLPASLSPLLIKEVLRGELGFAGVVITDSLSMGAITREYAAGDVGVLALEAGCDLLLLPQSYEKARDGILLALEEGRLTRARIRESVLRILALKRKAGLL